jgi:hypothetical protein
MVGAVKMLNKSRIAKTQVVLSHLKKSLEEQEKSANQD